MTCSTFQQRTRMFAGGQRCLPIAYPVPMARCVWRSAIDKLLNDLNLVSAEGLEPSTP